MVMVQPEKDRNGVEIQLGNVRFREKKRKKMAMRAYDQERS